MTGKYMLEALQNVDELLIAEADGIKTSKKVVKFGMTERQRDNLATAAIVVLMIGLVALIPVIKRYIPQSGLLEPGQSINSDVESRYKNISHKINEWCNYISKDIDESQVVDGILYEYDKDNDSYIVSSTGCTDVNISLAYGSNATVAGFATHGILDELENSMTYNVVVTPENASRMYYLVAFRGYEDNSDASSIDWNEASQQTFYEAVSKLGYEVQLVEGSGYYENEYGEKVYVRDDCIYGMLTYEQMKNIYEKTGYGVRYNIISKAKEPVINK